MVNYNEDYSGSDNYYRQISKPDKGGTGFKMSNDKKIKARKRRK